MPPETPTTIAARPTLAELQRRFHRRVTAVVPDDVDLGVAGDAGFPARERVALYADMYRHRLIEALAIDAPRAAAHLGLDYEAVAVDYFAACPPRSFTLREVSDRWAAFLAVHTSARERPWLADLAALERARLEVFDAADDALLEATAFGTQPEEVVLRLARAHRVLVLDRRALDAWAGEVPTAAPDRHDAWTVAIWRGRDPMVVHHRPLDDDEVALWPVLARGITFGRLCEALAADRSDEIAVAVAARLVNRWLDQGLLAA